MQKLHVTYVLDPKFAHCTTISLYSLLRHTKTQIDVELFLTAPSEELERSISKLQSMFPHANILLKSSPKISAAQGGKAHFTDAAMGRLLLASEIERRTVYLDGDTLVRADITPLFETDLDGNAIAACRDPRVWRSVLALKNRKLFSWLRPHRRRLDQFAKIEGLIPETYFNSGILLFDMAKIRDLKLDEKMADWKSAQIYPFPDQDHLNIIFRNHLKLVDPKWNSIWGNSKTDRFPFSPKEQQNYEASRSAPAIIHFTGKEKPWNSECQKRAKSEQDWAQEWHKIAQEWDRS